MVKFLSGGGFSFTRMENQSKNHHAIHWRTAGSKEEFFLSPFWCKCVLECMGITSFCRRRLSNGILFGVYFVFHQLLFFPLSIENANELVPSEQVHLLRSSFV